MVDLTRSPDLFATPQKDVPRAIVIGSSPSTSRASSPPAAHSTPTRRDHLTLDHLLGHRAHDDDPDTDHVTVDPPTSASVTPQTTPITAPASATDPPKSRKKRRSRSRSPPAPPPPMRTVRLEWALPRPGTAEHNDAYAVSIRDMARDTGQRPVSPVALPVPIDSDDEGTKGDTSAVEGGKEVKRRRRKRREELSEYDLSDAFIDDSDLQRDARTHFAQTKQQGFYVSSGEVALVKDKVAAKPRKRISNAPSKPLSKVAATKAAQRVQSNISVSNLAAALPQPMLTSGAPVYPRTPSPPIPLPPISTPANDPSFKPDLVQLSSFISDTPGPDDSRTSPIALDTEPWNQSIGNTTRGSDVFNTSSAGTKRQRTETNGTGTAGGSGAVTPSGAGPNGEAKAKKRKAVVDTEPFSSELEAQLRILHEEIKSYSWENKAKFPPALKPRLVEVATEALERGEYNENFFNYLPKIFPYNRFTMLKLTRRLMYPTHSERLRKRCDDLLAELKELVDQGLQAQESLHAAALEAWENKKATALAKWEEEMQQAQSNHVPQEQLPSRPEIPMPQKRYRWNDPIKENVWQQVCLCNEIAALANETHGFDQSLAPKMSEQSLRKNLYQKIVGVFPEGWLTSNLISREVSEMKRKEKKVADAGEGEDEEEHS
ncbi:Ubinuclein central domain containing protein [Ceratobasidium theobromae]|uniref:Ubinuclein central domain containing protein n=1 Tax=Ceratobasidium theobromae TaxID=1582974 RepID=A0A5N5QPW6_9AGAM|nr:Ubinuclein central domain containing protein [Ceratobasidium theobromae]